MASVLPFKQDRPADNARSFAAGVGAVDLTAITKLPNFGPQMTEVHNANAAASQSAVLTLDDNTTFTVVLAPNETRVIRTGVKALQASGADVSFACYWWIAPGDSGEWQYSATINP